MHSRINKVFGVISYFPDADTDYGRYVRQQRVKACTNLLIKLGELWPNIDIMIIAQNWQDYQISLINNKISIYKYDRLGVLKARKILREKFLSSNYTHLIMLDDDLVVDFADPEACMQLVDQHPDGFGIIRPHLNPLNFCVVPRDLYIRIEFPDIDIECGDGFADDIFIARCQASCSDLYRFLPDILRTEFDMLVPSTWRQDTPLDLDYMCRITETLTDAAYRSQHNYGSKEAVQPIDAVIAYVDSADPNWQADYIEYTEGMLDSHFTSNRFRSWGTLKYLLRGIETCMPFINNVFLLVSRESQVPGWIDKNQVTVVRHQDFIPAKYLPTFSSCTIEAFLGNIPELSEQFIYFNDDFFPIHLMQASDFFTDGMPHMKFQRINCIDSMFYQQCRTGMDMITDMLRLSRYPVGELLVPAHNAAPILKSSAVKIREACADAIDRSITSNREPKNINQYIYQYYQYFTGAYIEDYCPNLYLELGDKLQNLENIVNIGEIKLLCLNDMNTLKDYRRVKDQLIRIFEKKFPQRCKYEADD